MGQMTLGGGEVDRPAVAGAGGGQPLSPVQVAAIDKLRAQGELRSVEAGVICHRMREKGCVGRRTEGIGCCAHAAVDGNELMKRLMERGLVRRGEGRGLWLAVGL